MIHSDVAKVKDFAEEMGWSMERTRGYLDGVACQQTGQVLASHHKFSMDEYSKGFRTGYYTQACSLSISSIRSALAVA